MVVAPTFPFLFAGPRQDFLTLVHIFLTTTKHGVVSLVIALSFWSVFAIRPSRAVHFIQKMVEKSKASFDEVTTGKVGAHHSSVKQRVLDFLSHERLTRIASAPVTCLRDASGTPK